MKIKRILLLLLFVALVPIGLFAQATGVIDSVPIIGPNEYHIAMPSMRGVGCTQYYSIAQYGVHDHVAIVTINGTVSALTLTLNGSNDQVAANDTVIGSSSVAIGDKITGTGNYSYLKACITAYTGTGRVAVAWTGFPVQATGGGGGGGGGGDVNLTQVNSNSVNTGTGTASSGTQRVAVASDSSIVATQGTATNLKAQVVGAGTAGTANAGVVTVQGIASMTPVLTTLSGTNSITTVGAVTAITNALPAGTNVIGHVINDTGSTTAITGTVQVQSNSANLATETTIATLSNSQGSTTSGEKGPLIQGAVTTSSPTYTTAQTSPLSLDTGGALRVSVVSGSTGNAAAGPTGGAVPSQGDYQAININGTQRGLTGVNPTGSVYAAQGDIASIAGTVADSNSGNKSPGTLRVVLATDQPQLTNKLLVTPDSVALPLNQSVNVSQMNGITTAMGNGATSTGTQRVTLSNDSTGIVGLAAGTAVIGHVINDASSAVIGHVINDASSAVIGHVIVDTASTTAVTQATAANLNATVIGAGAAGTANAGVLTIQGIASMTPVQVTSTTVDASEGAAVATAPVPIGCVYRSSPGTLDAGDVGYPLCDTAGRFVMSGTVVEDAAETAANPLLGVGLVRRDTPASSAGTTGDNATFNSDATGNLWTHAVYDGPAIGIGATQFGAITTAMTGTTSTQVIAAVASNYLYITSCSFSNDHASVSTYMTLQDGSGGTALWSGLVPFGGGREKPFPTPLKVPTIGNALYVVNVTTGSSTKASCNGFSSTISY